MELKYEQKKHLVWGNVSFNCTFMELKFKKDII